MSRLLPRDPLMVAPGAVHLPGWLGHDAQRALVESCRSWVEQSGGPRRPLMPTGGTMSVAITCLGWHWYPYRYSRTADDGDGRPVDPFPPSLGELGRGAVTDAAAIDSSVRAPSEERPDMVPSSFVPDVALINWYGPGAHMGMHADRDERSPAPVVSVSLGDSCVFRFGTAAGRGRPWADVVLESGDVFVFGGPSRLAFHGVPKVLSGTGDPGIGLEEGRFNLTLRETGLSDGIGNVSGGSRR
jgi:DNA oxidative demethylase